MYYPYEKTDTYMEVQVEPKEKGPWIHTSDGRIPLREGATRST